MAAYLDAEPVLAGEGVLGLLLETLLALGQSLVPARILVSDTASQRNWSIEPRRVRQS